MSPSQAIAARFVAEFAEGVLTVTVLEQVKAARQQIEIEAAA